MNREARDALGEKIDGAIEAAPHEEYEASDEAVDRDPAASDETNSARRELNALNDRHLRLAAEFDNYRKRTERERAETWSRSQAELAAPLLDVLDDLQRVADMTPEAASAESLLEGIRLVERKLQRIMSAAGLEEVEAQDRSFDPASMEALMTLDAEDAAQDDSVGGVLQKGYRFKGHLLRPARVQVRKYNG